jgi:hypothetical protein
MATIRECKSRLITLLKIVDFFEENPFEQSFCGMSKRDALCLVQFYLKEQGSDISVLANLDFAQHVGKRFHDAYGSFESSLKLARTELAETIESVDILPQTAQPNLPLSQTLSQSSVPAELPEIVQKFQDSVLNVTGDSVPDPKNREARGQWTKAVVVHGLPLRDKWNKKKIAVTNPRTGEQEEYTNEQIVQDNFSHILNQQLADEREQERINRFNQQKTNLAGKAVAAAQNFSVTSGQTLSDQQLHDMEKIFTDVVDQPVFDQQTNTITQEAQLWENFVLKHPDAAIKTQDDFSQAKREAEVKNYYLNELVKNGVDKTMAGEIINQIGTRDLTEVSFLKYFRHLSTDPSLSPEGQQEKIGGLLAGKMLAAANQAVNAPGFDPAKKSQLVTDAVLETYVELANQGFSFLQAPDSVISQKLDENLQKKFYQRAIIRGQNVTISPIVLDSEIVLEAKELLSRQTAAVTTGEAGYHTLPIPGLMFMNEFQRTQIVGNEDLFKLLKTTNNVKNAALKYHSQHLAELDLQIQKAQKGEIKISPDGLKRLQANKAYVVSLTETGKINLLLESFGGHPISREKGFSAEEIALLQKYFETYQKILNNHKTLGGIIHTVAYWTSMNDHFTQGLRTKGGFIGFGASFFALPNIMLLQYGKAFISAALGDPSIAPYALSYFAKSFVVGAGSLFIKGQYRGLVDWGFKQLSLGTIGLLGKNNLLSSLIIGKAFPFLKGIFYVTDGHGMTHVTLLNPLQAAKVVWTEVWRSTAQKAVNTLFVWGARFLGKEILVTAISGPIGVIFGAFWIIWDFLIPDWVKKALAWAAAGFIFLLINLWGLIWPILAYLLGPLGLAFGLIGLIIGGPIAGLLGAFIGMSLGTTLFGLFGWHTAPGWIMSLAPGWSGITGVIGKALSGVWNALTATPAVSAAGGAGGAIAVGTATGAGVAAYAGIAFLHVIMWTPVTPQAVPGGLVAQDFTVEKSVAPTNPTHCPDFATKKNCKNAVTISSNDVGFEYILRIVAAPGKTISNIQIKDKITIIARGPCGTNLEDKCPKDKATKTYEITPIIPDTSSITLPTADGKNAIDVKYPIPPLLLQDEKYRNSAVFNLVEVAATGQKATNGTAFTIGDPPPSLCPLNLGRITCGSLGGSFTACQHGNDSYWNKITTCTKSNTYWIPMLGQARYSKSTYGGTTNKCYNPNDPEAKDYYGFALDIVSSASDAALFPYISSVKINWTRETPFYPNPGPAEENHIYGWSVIYRGTDESGGHYRMGISHINKDTAQDNGSSGDVMAMLYVDNAMGKHLHIELSTITNGTEQFHRPEDVLKCY